jgi:aminoglycoside phosphotransferase (APT) family kinase protein
VPESLTKRHLDAATLNALIAEAFGPQTGITDCRELGEGFFNAAFRLLLTDGRDVVLKASPPPGAALLTYERDIMRAEVEFFGRAAATGVPQPELLYAGFERTVIDGDFIVLSALGGVTWDSVRADLDDSQATALRREAGGHLARLHRVLNQGGSFGYPAASELSAPAWPDAFAVMLSALVDDADRYGVGLPVSGGELRETVRRHADALAAVTDPALVHFDLWPGNILITPPEGGTPPRISGLIDGERMIWGDPLMEFVGVDVFGRADRDLDLLAGYLGAGGLIADEDGSRRRLALYHLYMQLLLLIEVVPRGYSDAGYVGFIGSECPKRIVAAVEELG